MLGELIEETKGKRVVRRVLSTDPFRVEVSFESTGKLLGNDVMEIATYTSNARADGSLYGEGEGAYMSSSGDVITWKGAGVGTIGAGGSVSYRGAVYYSTASQKFTRLNGVAGVFEFQSDANGDTRSKTWEWK
jgi:hypothetical protein